ncbi:MAG: formate dehydrogenase accessory protein FdhE [Candidatus Cloacimonadota bacterium]|nr:MAG: formate dehydrogenase accessory protein FdhE [Candidatus Cloacimonadota bacterium]
MSIKTIGQIKKGIKSIEKTRQFEKESLVHIEKFFRFSLNVKRSAKKRIETAPAFSGDCKEKIEKGEHLADFSKIKINDNFLLDKFHKICEIRAEINAKEMEEIQKMKKAIDNEKIDFSKIQQNLARGKIRYFDTLSKKIGVGKELLHSIALAVYKPIFELTVEEKKDLIEDYVWEKGSCPMCGTNPGMAKLEKEVGRRLLWCPLCSSEWVYRRMKCPFCENDEQKSLRFFYVDDDSFYRVDVCETCKGYVKTIDERKRGKEEKTIFEIEDIKTFYLDDIALKEGYKKI